MLGVREDLENVGASELEVGWGRGMGVEVGQEGGKGATMGCLRIKLYPIRWSREMERAWVSVATVVQTTSAVAFKSLGLRRK